MHTSIPFVVRLYGMTQQVQNIPLNLLCKMKKFIKSNKRNCYGPQLMHNKPLLFFYPAKKTMNILQRMVLRNQKQALYKFTLSSVGIKIDSSLAPYLSLLDAPSTSNIKEIDNFNHFLKITITRYHFHSKLKL